MEGDELRPVRPFGTPWTLGRMAADTCAWLAWRDPARAEHDAMNALLAYRREARIEIVKTDTVDTERTEGVSGDEAIDRILETAGIVELLGPAILDHSRLDHCVLAGDEDGERLDEVFAVLFPAPTVTERAPRTPTSCVTLCTSQRRSVKDVTPSSRPTAPYCGRLRGFNPGGISK